MGVIATFESQRKSLFCVDKPVMAKSPTTLLQIHEMPSANCTIISCVVLSEDKTTHVVNMNYAMIGQLSVNKNVKSSVTMI